MHKGQEFTPEKLSKGQRARLSPERIADICAEQTARFKIVAIDKDEREDRQAITAEELQPRALNKLSPKAKRIAGSMVLLEQSVRAEILGAFDDDGNLKIPFKLIG